MKHLHRDRFPRTLTEAFGCDASSAVAVRRYRKPLSLKVIDLLGAIAIGTAFGVLFAAFV
jgi:hypothetical protein